MNVTITPGAATEDAVQIDSIIEQIQNDLDNLNAAIKNTIPGGIQTSWSETVRENWEKYYSADVPAAIEDMKLSAANLRLAVEKTLSYDQEQS